MCPYFQEMDDLFGERVDVNLIYQANAQNTNSENNEPVDNPLSSPSSPDINSSIAIDPLLTGSEYIAPSGKTNYVVSGSSDKNIDKNI